MDTSSAVSEGQTPSEVFKAANKRILTEFRRFSTICSPGLDYSDVVSIPEVVVTSHDQDEDFQELSSISASSRSLGDRRRRLQRSLSSPEAVTSSSSSLPQHQHFIVNKNDDFTVTLEDVQKFKFLRKTSGCSSTEDRWVAEEYDILRS